jgi:hypothetical protein
MGFLEIHVEERTRGAVQRATHASEWRRSDDAEWRELTHEEMDAMIASGPELLSDRHQTVGKVYTVVTDRRSVAERLGFAETLVWLKGLGPAEGLRAVILWEP